MQSSVTSRSAVSAYGQKGEEAEMQMTGTFREQHNPAFSGSDKWSTAMASLGSAK